MTEAEADLVASAALVTVTVTVVLALTAGAVKSPELEIDPAVADQVTAVLVEPVTVAENCWVPTEATEALFGDIETATGEGEVPTTETWNVWFVNPSHVFWSIVASEAVDAPTTSIQPLATFPDRIV